MTSVDRDRHVRGGKYLQLVGNIILGVAKQCNTDENTEAFDFASEIDSSSDDDEDLLMQHYAFESHNSFKATINLILISIAQACLSADKIHESNVRFHLLRLLDQVQTQHMQHMLASERASCVRYVTALRAALSKSEILESHPMILDLKHALGGVHLMLAKWDEATFECTGKRDYYSFLWAMSWRRTIDTLCEMCPFPNQKMSRRSTKTDAPRVDQAVAEEHDDQGVNDMDELKRICTKLYSLNVPVHRTFYHQCLC
jgi:hypothetical protein